MVRQEMLVSGGGVSLCCLVLLVDSFEDFVASGIRSFFDEALARFLAFLVWSSLILACRSASVAATAARLLGGLKSLVFFLGEADNTGVLATIAGRGTLGCESGCESRV